MVLSKEIQTQLVEALKAGPVNGGAVVPAKSRGQPGIFVTAAEWKERGYIMNDEVRAKNLPGLARVVHREHREEVTGRASAGRP